MGALIMLLICGGITASVASSKGRSVIGWFVLGFFFGIFAILAVCLVSNLKEEEEYRDHIERENRRLKEQLKQEQLKAETFRGHVTQRLDTHDHALGMDTRSGGTLLEQGRPREMQQLDGSRGASLTVEADPVELVQVESPPSLFGEAAGEESPVRWFYRYRNEVRGPVTGWAIRQLFDNGTIRGDTSIRRQGDVEFKLLRETEEFGAICRTASPQP